MNDADSYQEQALKTETTPVFINPEIYGGDRDKAHMMSRVMHGMMGVVTEIGEAMDVLKKHFIYGKPIDWVNVMEEAGDKAWYIALILHAGGYRFSDALERNIAKLKKRFGSAFSQEAALNRDLDAERATLEGPRCRVCGHTVTEDLRSDGARGNICVSLFDCDHRRTKAHKTVYMALCEIDHLFLKPGVRYVFDQRPGCAGCEAYAKGQGRGFGEAIDSYAKMIDKEAQTLMEGGGLDGWKMKAVQSIAGYAQRLFLSKWSDAKRVAEELLAATAHDEAKDVIPSSPEISELGRRLAKKFLGPQ